MTNVPANAPSSEATGSPQIGFARAAAAAVPVAALAASLLHPRIPEVRRSLRRLLPSDWTYLDTACQFGYLAHSVAFVSVTAFLVVLFGGPVARSRRIWAVVIAFGIATETLQLAIPYRDFDPYDMLCNLLAASCGYAIGRGFVSGRPANLTAGGPTKPCETVTEPASRAA